LLIKWSIEPTRSYNSRRMLPDADGFSIFRILQQDERTMDIPVIFVTVKEGDREKGIKMGAGGYIVKPFREEEVKETIKSILEKG